MVADDTPQQTEPEKEPAGAEPSAAQNTSAGESENAEVPGSGQDKKDSSKAPEEKDSAKKSEEKKDEGKKKSEEKTITITYSAGFDLDGVAVMNTTLGINKVQTSALSLYPNPANHSAIVTFEAQSQRTSAILYDMTGRAVAAIPVEAGATTITLNTATLANGIYMLHMAGNVEKLVIRH